LCFRLLFKTTKTAQLFAKFPQHIKNAERLFNMAPKKKIHKQILLFLFRRKNNSNVTDVHCGWSGKIGPRFYPWSSDQFTQYLKLATKARRTRIHQLCLSQQIPVRWVFTVLYAAESRVHHVMPSVRILNDIEQKPCYESKSHNYCFALAKTQVHQMPNRSQFPLRICVKRAAEMKEFAGKCSKPLLWPSIECKIENSVKNLASERFTITSHKTLKRRRRNLISPNR